MKKRIIAMICLIVIFAAFTGCKNKSIYVDPAGNTLIAVLDENGNTVLNDEGDIVVYQTDKNGEVVTDESGVSQTQASIFPNQITDGDLVQTPTYTVKLPSGWKVDEAINGMFNKKSAEAEMKIDIVEESDFDAYYNKTLSFFDKLKESEDGSAITIKEDTFDYVAANTKAHSFFAAKKDDNGVMMNMVLILFENGGNIYRITCQCAEENYTKANFEELYSAINFKNFKYFADK